MPHPHAARAWELLRTGPYSTPSGTWSESQDSLFTARPRLTATSAAAWSPGAMRYDPSTVHRALAELLQVAPALRTTDSYRFDLVDVARQALANRSRTLLPQIKAAYDAKDLPGFRERAAEWKSDLALLDRLLATDTGSLLGPWLEDAKSWGPHEGGEGRCRVRRPLHPHHLGPPLRQRLGWPAGLREPGVVRAGLRLLRDALDDVPRLPRYRALATGRAPVAIDWFALENAWNQQRDSYPVRASGDPVALAAAVLDAPPAPAPAGPPSGAGPAGGDA